MFIRRSLIVAAACLLPAAAQAQSLPDLAGLNMYGINKTTGLLAHYDFDQQVYQEVGLIHKGLNTAMPGIDAAAYVPGMQNIFTFWKDPSDGLSHLWYVNCETAQATPVGQTLGSGTFTGATVVLTNGNDQWLTPLLIEASLAGSLNINPNNSPSNEFTLTTSDGQVITRDDLHHASDLPADGTFFQGSAANVRIKPKGDGSQNTLVFDGHPYTVSNSQTYLFSGQMNVRVYNDHVHKNGKAMGHWWLQITDGTVTIDGGNDSVVLTIPGEWFVVAVQSTPGTPHAARLLIVDHLDGSTQLLMHLDRTYDNLAWHDGKTFYATSGDKLYRLAPETGEETLLGAADPDAMWGLEFAGDKLISFDAGGDQVLPLSTANPALFTLGQGIGMYDLGSILFVPRDKDPLNKPKAFD